jgi:hypothetical protein
MVIHLHRRLNQAVADFGGSHVFHIAQTQRQRQSGRIALGLRSNIAIDFPLQSFARAGNLRETGRGGQAARLRE